MIIKDVIQVLKQFDENVELLVYDDVSQNEPYKDFTIEMSPVEEPTIYINRSEDEELIVKEIFINSEI